MAELQAVKKTLSRKGKGESKGHEGNGDDTLAAVGTPTDTDTGAAMAQEEDHGTDLKTGNKNETGVDVANTEGESAQKHAACAVVVCASNPSSASSPVADVNGQGQAGISNEFTADKNAAVADVAECVEQLAAQMIGSQRPVDRTDGKEAKGGVGMSKTFADTSSGEVGPRAVETATACGSIAPPATASVGDCAARYPMGATQMLLHALTILKSATSLTARHSVPEKDLPTLNGIKDSLRRADHVTHSSAKVTSEARFARALQAPLNSVLETDQSIKSLTRDLQAKQALLGKLQRCASSKKNTRYKRRLEEVNSKVADLKVRLAQVTMDNQQTTDSLRGEISTFIVQHPTVLEHMVGDSNKGANAADSQPKPVQSLDMEAKEKIEGAADDVVQRDADYALKIKALTSEVQKLEVHASDMAHERDKIKRALCKTSATSTDIIAKLRKKVDNQTDHIVDVEKKLGRYKVQVATEIARRQAIDTQVRHLTEDNARLRVSFAQLSEPDGDQKKVSRQEKKGQTLQEGPDVQLQKVTRQENKGQTLQEGDDAQVQKVTSQENKTQLAQEERAQLQKTAWLQTSRLQAIAEYVALATEVRGLRAGQEKDGIFMRLLREKVSKLQTELDERNAMVSKLQTGLAARNDMVTTPQTSLAEHKDKVTKLQAEIAERDDKLRAAHETQQALLSAACAEVARLSAELQAEINKAGCDCGAGRVRDGGRVWEAKKVELVQAQNKGPQVSKQQVQKKAIEHKRGPTHKKEPEQKKGDPQQNKEQALKKEPEKMKGPAQKKEPEQKKDQSKEKIEQERKERYKEKKRTKQQQRKKATKQEVNDEEASKLVKAATVAEPRTYDKPGLYRPVYNRRVRSFSSPAVFLRPEEQAEK